MTTFLLRSVRSLLLDADANSWDSDGCRPLHHAVRGGSLAVVAQLLLARADCRALDRQGRSALQLCRSLVKEKARGFRGRTGGH